MHLILYKIHSWIHTWLISHAITYDLPSTPRNSEDWPGLQKEEVELTPWTLWRLQAPRYVSKLTDHFMDPKYKNINVTFWTLFLSYASMTSLVLTSCSVLLKNRNLSALLSSYLRFSIVIPASGWPNVAARSVTETDEKGPVLTSPTCVSRGCTLTIKSIISCNYDLILHPFLPTMRKRTIFPLLDNKNTPWSESSLYSSKC